LLKQGVLTRTIGLDEIMRDIGIKLGGRRNKKTSNIM